MRLGQTKEVTANTLLGITIFGSLVISSDGISEKKGDCQFEGWIPPCNLRAPLYLWISHRRIGFTKPLSFFTRKRIAGKQAPDPLMAKCPVLPITVKCDADIMVIAFRDCHFLDHEDPSVIHYSARTEGEKVNTGILDVADTPSFLC
ncbi:hypothetical protein RRG08_065241 [Elysia crispata]|uniref:Uncharacterized protein n=1 Tax=Elysia crispata TaxID=231223 RepID=A0AAE0YHI0_9GAST|nr:hypothetical protein RRG08_065241 [Elysia crispata]